MSPIRVKRLGLAALGLSALTLIAVGIFVLHDYSEFRSSAEIVAQVRRILEINQSLLAHLIDAETGQRGFLLTGEASYLEPFDAAAKSVPVELDELESLTRSDPPVAENVVNLRALAGQKFDELRRTIELRRSDGLAAALQVVETGQGRQVMDRLRAISAVISDAQENRRAMSWTALYADASIARRVALGGSFLLVGLVLSGSLLLNRAARAQAALTASAAQARDLLRTTLYSIGDAVITTDAGGAVRAMNPAAERLTGYSEAEAQGVPAERVFHIVNEETRQEVESPIRRVLREGRVVGLANHTVLVSRSGQDLPIDDSGAPIRGSGKSLEGVVLVFRDVTERKKAEEALQQSERRFRTVADSAPVMIWSEAPDGARDYFNRPWLEFRGRAIEQELGSGWEEGIHPDDRARHATLLTASAVGYKPYGLEYRLQRADGQYRWVLSRGVPRFGAGGDFLGYIGTCVDIDDARRAEDKVRQAAKLESLGVLAGGIAHDFNNLLVGIMGNASLLEDFVPEASPARELLASLLEASERAAKLTRQMLAYSGRGRFLVAAMDLSEQVRQITALVTASVPKEVELRLALADGLPPVEADTSQIQQLVMNLVINAAEAVGPSGGRVEISSTSREVAEGEVSDLATGDTLSAGTYVVLTVSDNGCGMDSETLSKIFDPFFTTKFTGRGLGLAAVLGIVRGHRGAIRVDSSPGQGSTFQVYLPAAALPRAPAAAPEQILAGTGTILVVDDEEVVRRTARAALEHAGYSVSIAAGGEQAVEIFRSHSAEIRLVVLDMSMPGMSGEDSLRALRAIRPDVPVVISTGYSEVEAHRRFGGSVQGYLPKPYSAGDLARALQSALNGGV